jgi:hypothetical protein
MERNVIVVFVARKLLQTLGVLGRDVGAQLHDHAALARVDQKRSLRVGSGRQPLLGKGRCDGEENCEECEQARHGGFLLCLSSYV